MSNEVPAFVIPIIEGLAAALKPAIFVSILLPLLVAVLYFSTAQSRRTPLSISLAIALLLSISLGMWTDYSMIHVMLHQLDGVTPHYNVAFGTLQIVTMTVIDVVLLFRLLAVFPPMTTPRLKLAAIVIPPIIFKIVRVAVWVVAANKYLIKMRGVDKVNSSTDETWKTLRTEEAIGWVFTAIDNAFASTIFLWKLRGSFERNPESGRVVNHTSDSLAMRIRALFWMATTNFVFPVILNIVQIIISFRNSNSGTYLWGANIFVSVLCATFATVWSSTRMYRRQTTPFGSANLSTGIAIARLPVVATSSSSTGPETPRRYKSEDGDWFDRRRKDEGMPIPLAVRIERCEETQV